MNNAKQAKDLKAGDVIVTGAAIGNLTVDSDACQFSHSVKVSVLTASGDYMRRTYSAAETVNVAR